MTMNYKEKQFSIVWQGEGKAEPLLGLPLHLTSGFDCVRSLTLSAFYDLSCLSHRLYSSSSLPLFIPPLFLLYAPCHCRLSVNQQATYQRLLLQLCCSSSFSGIGIGTAHLLYFPSSPLAVCSMCISIHPNVITRFNMSAGCRGRVHYSAVFLSKCNVDSESSSGAGLGRECVHDVASAVMDTFGFFSTVIYT